MWRQEPLNYHTSSFAAVSAGPMCRKFLCVSGSISWTSGCMARGALDYAEMHAGMPRAVQSKLGRVVVVERRRWSWTQRVSRVGLAGSRPEPACRNRFSPKSVVCLATSSLPAGHVGPCNGHGMQGSERHARSATDLSLARFDQSPVPGPVAQLQTLTGSRTLPVLLLRWTAFGDPFR